MLNWTKAKKRKIAAVAATVALLLPFVLLAQTVSLSKGVDGGVFDATTSGATFMCPQGATMAVYVLNQSDSAGRVCIAINEEGSAITCAGTDADFDNGHIALGVNEFYRAENLTAAKIGYKAASTADVWIHVAKVGR